MSLSCNKYWAIYYVIIVIYYNYKIDNVLGQYCFIYVYHLCCLSNNIFHILFYLRNCMKYLDLNALYYENIFTWTLPYWNSLELVTSL